MKNVDPDREFEKSVERELDERGERADAEQKAIEEIVECFEHAYYLEDSDELARRVNLWVALKYEVKNDLEKAMDVYGEDVLECIMLAGDSTDIDAYIEAWAEMLYTYQEKERD